MKEKDISVDWDYFWKRVNRHPIFLRYLYFVHLKKYAKLIKNVELSEPNILELGAGTGQASIYLKEQFGGKITLVDSNALAYKTFETMCKDQLGINYIRTDLFDFEHVPDYDIVLSDGLLEHFSDKQAIIEKHKYYTREDGYIIIFALNNNLFTRFLELGEKQMGYSEPISLKECLKLCESCGLSVINTVSYFFEYGILCKKMMVW